MMKAFKCNKGAAGTLELFVVSLTVLFFVIVIIAGQFTNAERISEIEKEIKYFAIEVERKGEYKDVDRLELQEKLSELSSNVTIEVEKDKENNLVIIHARHEGNNLFGGTISKANFYETIRDIKVE